MSYDKYDLVKSGLNSIMYRVIDDYMAVIIYRLQLFDSSAKALTYPRCHND